MDKLIIAPHVDDEVIGCGGMLDNSCQVIFCGLQPNHIIPAAERMIEIENVSKHFGYKWHLMDGEVNKYDEHNFIDAIQDLINVYTPHIIYLPYPSYNQDHRAIYNASMIALRPHDNNWFVKKVLVYEELDAFQWYKPAYEVNRFVPIDIDRKIEGYKLHVSQVRDHRSGEHLKALSLLRGSQSGYKYAEAYIIKRWVD